MPLPFFSVVIPTYNYAEFVAEAVASALGQDYPHFEVIVVDAGSMDDTRARLAPLMPRIRYIHQQNQGLSAARNTGIQAARGEYIALLDSDDTWHPRKLSVQARYLAEHPEIGVLATEHLLTRASGWPVVPENETPVRVYPVEELVMRSWFAPSSAVILKACFDRVGLFDTALRCVEDRDMWIRISCHYPVEQLRAPLCWYRIHDANMSHAAARMEEYELKVLHKAFVGVPELRGRMLLQAKAQGLAAYNAAYMYGLARNWPRALDRLTRSLVLWPFPYRPGEVHDRLARPKALTVLVLRMLGLKEPESLHKGAAAAVARTT
ncbi:MAG: glycosyltransferase [Planctomycetes bacterium]|nr:glycosyltransferase [Planctomycetota bacterium]